MKSIPRTQPGQNGRQEGSWDRERADDRAEVGTKNIKYRTWKERGNLGEVSQERASEIMFGGFYRPF